ncbi:hypothetical protein [Larkinella sp. C7]|uniref:hypothetical protein n=1 Tax=Larkinella sp. C7 TaxID=2576607 RepID=UPI001111080D|nr:hypothetical protein [Larkinella sp. C7]
MSELIPHFFWNQKGIKIFDESTQQHDVSLIDAIHARNRLAKKVRDRPYKIGQKSGPARPYPFQTRCKLQWIMETTICACLLSPVWGYQQISFTRPDLGSALEVLNQYVRGGALLLSASLSDPVSCIHLPVEAFDGSPIRCHLWRLEQEWQQLINV